MFRKLKSVVVFLKIIAFIIVIITLKRIKAQKVDRSETIYIIKPKLLRESIRRVSARLTAGSDRRESIDIENQLIH